MFNQLITGDLVRKENGLRWLTRQLKPLCRDLGSHPSVGRLFPSMGLQESSIMRDFICSLMLATCCCCKPQKWSEFGQIEPWAERAQSLLSATINVFQWFGRERMTIHVENGGVFLRILPTLGKIKYSRLLPLPKTAIKAHSIPDSIPVLNVSSNFLLNNCGNSLDY